MHKFLVGVKWCRFGRGHFSSLKVLRQVPFCRALSLHTGDGPAHGQNEARVWLLIPALLMITKHYVKKFRKEDWLKSFTVECYGAIKKNEEVLYKKIWTNLPDVV